MARIGALHQPRAQTRVAQTRPAELVLRPDRGRDRRQPPAAPRPVQAPRGGCATPARIRHRRRLRVSGAACGDPGDRTAGLTHPNPVRRAHARPRLFGLVDERRPAASGAIAIQPLAVVADVRTTRPSTCEARLRHTMPGRTSSRHSPTTRCKCGTPARIVRTQASRDRSRRALAANPTAQPAMRRTHQIPRGPTNGPSSARVLVEISVFVSCRCSSVSTSARVGPTTADRARHVHRRRQRVRDPRPADHRGHLDPQAARRGRPPALARQQLGVATGPARRRTLHSAAAT